MKKVLIGFFIMGLTTQGYAQIIKTEELSEVFVYATNYKYLNSLDTQEEASISVEMLQRKVAAFDLKSSEFYEDNFYQDDFDLYKITFFIPDGKILAAYDRDGKLIRTAEKFKDVNLPGAVKKSISDKFPGWTVTKDVYIVNYHDKKGVEKKYKLKLENSGETIRVKLDEKGTFL